MSNVAKPKIPRISVDTTRITPAIVKQDRSERSAGIGLFIVGLAMLPLGPALIAYLTWSMQAEAIRASHAQPVSWWTHFGISSAICIPIGLLMSSQGATAVVDDAASRLEGARVLRRGRLGAVIFTLLISLLGPGILWYAFRKLRATKRFASVSRERTAQVLGKLLIFDQGIDVFELLAPRETLDHLLPVLEYLCHYEWAGASKTGERIWPSPKAREQLNTKSRSV